jgi:hypothetical protein
LSIPDPGSKKKATKERDEKKFVALAFFTKAKLKIILLFNW